MLLLDPGGIALSDSPTDGDSGLAPEITIVTASVTAAGGYSVDPGITEPLKAGDSVFRVRERRRQPRHG